MSLANTADIAIARENAAQPRRVGFSAAADCVEACASSAELAGELLAVLKLLDNGYKYSTDVCNIARAAIAKTEARS